MKNSDIKIITHHFGGMIPFFAEKIGIGFQQIFRGDNEHNPLAEQAGLKKQPKDYFKMFYADTATNGSSAAAACGRTPRRQRNRWSRCRRKTS